MCSLLWKRVYRTLPSNSRYLRLHYTGLSVAMSDCFCLKAAFLKLRQNNKQRTLCAVVVVIYEVCN
jgi:hypothetical protein